MYDVSKRPTSDQRTDRLKVKGWKKIFHANGEEKNWGSSTYIQQNRLEN